MVRLCYSFLNLIADGGILWQLQRILTLKGITEIKHILSTVYPFIKACTVFNYQFNMVKYRNSFQWKINKSYQYLCCKKTVHYTHLNNLHLLNMRKKNTSMLQHGRATSCYVLSLLNVLKIWVLQKIARYLLM